MDKLVLKQQDKMLYAPSAKDAALVTVPAMQFLMVDGTGNPNHSARFQAAVEALYALSYTLKFLVRAEREIDYGVLPLEGLWWVPDMAEFDINMKEHWLWTVMIRQPDFVTAEQVERARVQAAGKKELVLLSELRFETFVEGLSAQILHIGPFSEEGPTVEKLHRFILEQGCAITGKHHEIYLSDIRRAAPEKWRTVVRQGVACSEQ